MAKRLGLAVLCCLFAILAVDFCGVFVLQMGIAEVCIDSGDRRLRGMILSWPEGPVPGRAFVVKAAAELGIGPEWHAPPFTAPSNPDQGRFFQYSRIAWWAEHEPPLGRLLLRQFAEYYRHPPAESGLPAGSAFLFMLDWDPKRGCFELSERAHAQERAALQQLVDELGYVPDAGGVVSGLLDSSRVDH